MTVAVGMTMHIFSRINFCRDYNLEQSRRFNEGIKNSKSSNQHIMRILLFSFVTFLFNISLAQGQIHAEKMGLVVSSKKALQSYNDADSPFMSKKDYVMNRLGGRVSFALNCRLSFDTGLYFDHHQINLASKNNKGLFKRGKSAEGVQLRNITEQNSFLESHTMLNTTIPFNIMFRTYISNSCVTYLRLSYNHSFNIYESEDYSDVYSGDDLFLKTQKNELDSEAFGFKYYGSDVEFAFGNFWNLKKLNAQLCIEPTITLVSNRTQNTAIEDPSLVLYDKHQRAFSAIGFEVMLYKNLN